MQSIFINVGDAVCIWQTSVSVFGTKYEAFANTSHPEIPSLRLTFLFSYCSLCLYTVYVSGLSTIPPVFLFDPLLSKGSLTLISGSLYLRKKIEKSSCRDLCISVQ